MRWSKQSAIPAPQHVGNVAKRACLIDPPTRITDSEVLRRVHDAGLLGVIDLASLDCDPQHEGGFFIALKNGPTLLSLEPA